MKCGWFVINLQKNEPWSLLNGSIRKEMQKKKAFGQKNEANIISRYKQKQKADTKNIMQRTSAFFVVLFVYLPSSCSFSGILIYLHFSLKNCFIFFRLTISLFQ